MFHFHKKTLIKITAFFSFAFFLLCSGCVPEEENRLEVYLLPGETTTRIKAFCFYIGNNAKPKDQLIRSIPAAAYPLLTADPVWSMPQGLEVKTSSFTFSPKLIEWSDDMKYSVLGTKLTIEYEVSADASATAGKGAISVSFANLNLFRGEDIFYIQENCLLPPKANPTLETWKLNNVVVFANAAEKESATTKSNINYILAGVVVVALIIGVIAIYGWAKSR
ncbi:MAG: hypothetical protein CVU39_21170 [Chloroflexi bacterium HGW-Chloroflexi-10]|nr:MAG: hypothetical protein CVU39_21170 [Chloroflexi bacterium HGW-Chloroflexi-10]